MADYCSTTDVDKHLPSGHSQSANLATYVTRASGWADSFLGRIYDVPLPAYGATPGTPDDLREIVAKRGAYYGMLAESQTNKMSDVSYTQQLRAETDDEIEKYVVPAGNPLKRLPSASVTGEAMTFGTDPLGDNDWKFTNATRRISRETVEISGYEYGLDFRVWYSPRFRGWILTRLTTEIADGATVSYEYTYFPNSGEEEEMVEPESMKVVRG